MKTYDVVVYETVRKVIEVEAKSKEDAEDYFYYEWEKGYPDNYKLIRKQIVDCETISVDITPPGILRRRKKQGN
jgi:hypothetical protein